MKKQVENAGDSAAHDKMHRHNPHNPPFSEALGSFRMIADELGAHVSNAKGVQNAPGRAAERNSVVLQLFTKMASRWAEPIVTDDIANAFRAECQRHNIMFTASHDSYLINLATSDVTLFERSRLSFASELERCSRLKLDALVTHPGNATGGDAAWGLAQNAEAVGVALEADAGSTIVLFESTAGAGTALGANFRELALLIERIGPALAHRVGVCLDTCHLWAAGYDLANHYDDVMAELEDTIGLDKVRLFHLNDSVAGLGSRRDRHAHIGAGALGEQPFRRLITDDRFRAVPKVIETPKDDDVLRTDLQNLEKLRSYRANRSKNE
jgi:deoxyribonuclease-4